MGRATTFARAAASILLVLTIACTSTSSGPTASATPKPEKLTVVHGATIDFLDPQLTRRPEGFDIVENINEGFIARDPKTMAPIPALALSWQQPDATTWTFKLRPNVKFTNGEPFDAEVVKWNFARVVKPSLMSTIGGTLATLVKSVEAVDPLTVRITTTSPAPFLLERLARMYFLPPKDSEARGDTAISQFTIGTGPYKLVEWKPGQSVTLTRNDDYWGPKPAYKDIVVREIQETGTAISELLAGNVDLLKVVPQDQIELVNKSGKATVTTAPSSVIVEVAFDALGRTAKTPWMDKRVRQAANYAVDRESISKNLMGGLAKPVAGFLSPPIFGFDPNLKPYPYDVAKAKALLAEAGYPNGFETEIKIYPLGSFVDQSLLAQAIVSELGKVGIRMSIKQVSSAEIGPLVREGKAGPVYIRQAEAAGAFDAALAFSFIQTGSVFAYFNNADMEKLRAQAASSTNPEERKRLYVDIQKIVHDEAPMIFGWTGFSVHGIANNVDYQAQTDNRLRFYLAKPK
jgi:peptide/nickel transport system substrate-binding protein